MLARKALAGTAGAPKLYVEDVMSTYLYTGNGSTQTITNNIDLSTEGGLVWIKGRSGSAVYSHVLTDTARGVSRSLYSNLTNAAGYSSGLGLTAFNSNGFSLNDPTGTGMGVNEPSTNYVSWTFRKAKKFFDVVTYTGNGSNRTISHNLGSVPGCIIVKEYSSGGDWMVYHRSLGNTDYVRLNTTGATAAFSTVWNNTTPTSTEFTVGTSNAVNANGASFVAYLFAHDAGGFGDAGSDNVITCGSLTTGSSGYTSVNLGYEPQWVMVKTSAVAGSWIIVDNMRGLPVTGNSPSLSANNSNAEDTARNDSLRPTATGFDINADFYGSSRAFIYIAIRRGPMKTPTDATKVFAVTSFTGVDAAQTSNFPVDFVMNSENLTGTVGWYWVDRLRGATKKLESNATSAEGSVSSGVWDSNTTVKISGSGNSYKRSYPMFRRAPGFFDVVCYTGTGSGPRWINHNLTTAPQFIIVKSRSNAESWTCSVPAIGQDKVVYINLNTAASTDATMFPSAPTSTQFRVADGGGNTNANGYTYVAYLFASVSGVSKVGSYTGNGSSVTVTTGFQPRFIMVKRTDSTGNWIVGDSARGLVSGSDPYLLLNSTAAEDTDEDWVDVSSTGFTVNQTTAANANVNTGTYIYLCIA